MRISTAEVTSARTTNSRLEGMFGRKHAARRPTGPAASSRNCVAASAKRFRPQIALDYIERLLKDY